MSFFGPDAPFWRAVDIRWKEFFAKEGLRLLRVQVLEVGTEDNVGKIKVRDPDGGEERDIFYPQTNPDYVPEIDEWMWALANQGGLLLISPAAGSPIGSMSQWAGLSDPTDAGWVLCDGRVLDAVAYPAAFAVLGTTYNVGGEAAAQFRVPDMRGRTPVGAGLGTGLTNRTLGFAFGAENHALGITEIPSHGHPASTGADSHNHTGSVGNDTHSHGITIDQFGMSGTFGTGRNVLSSQNWPDTPHGFGTAAHTHGHTVTINDDSHSHTVSITNTGGGGSHNNMQPSIALNYIIRVA